MRISSGFQPHRLRTGPARLMLFDFAGGSTMRVPLTVFVARTSSSRLLVHALAAWALSAVLLVVLLATLDLPPLVANGLYAVGAPAFAGLIGAHYAYRREDAADPLTTAAWFTAIAAALDLVAGSFLQGRVELFDPALGLGIPLMLVFGATGLAGELVPRTVARARR